MKKTTIIFMMILLLVLTACTPTTKVTEQPTVSPVEQSASATPSPKPVMNQTAASLKPGETVQLSVSGVENAEWASSDPFVAKVNETGLVVGRHKSGSTTITAQANGVTYTCTITNTADMRDISAQQIVSKIKVGVNFASALDVIDWDLRFGYDPYLEKQEGLDKLHYYLKRVGTTRQQQI